MPSLKTPFTRVGPFLLILKILVSGIKLFSFISSKNTYLVKSISKSLDAAFCFADFFWGTGSPIQEKVILFLKISQVVGTVAVFGVFQAILEYMRVRRNHTQCLFRLKLVLFAFPNSKRYFMQRKQWSVFKNILIY